MCTSAYWRILLGILKATLKIYNICKTLMLNIAKIKWHGSFHIFWRETEGVCSVSQATTLAFVFFWGGLKVMTQACGKPRKNPSLLVVIASILKNKCHYGSSPPLYAYHLFLILSRWTFLTLSSKLCVHMTHHSIIAEFFSAGLLSKYIAGQ